MIKFSQQEQVVKLAKIFSYSENFYVYVGFHLATKNFNLVTYCDIIMMLNLIKVQF